MDKVNAMNYLLDTIFVDEKASIIEVEEAVRALSTSYALTDKGRLAFIGEIASYALSAEDDAVLYTPNLVRAFEAIRMIADRDLDPPKTRAEAAERLRG